MTVLSIDFETRATVDLRATGVYPYAKHPDTDIWCMAWAFDDEEPQLWTPHDGPSEDVARQRPHLPPRVGRHLFHDRGEVRAWNAQFERTIWREIMAKRYCCGEVALEQWVCSAAEAAAMALPRSLDSAASVLGVQQQKDKDGYGLMMRMTRPRSINPDGTPVWWDTKDKLQRLYAYCMQDVRTERALVKALRRLTPHEREIYLLDQRVNDRGIAVDRMLVTAATEIVREGVERANIVLAQLTGGAVTKVSNHKALTDWVRSEGVETPGVAKAAVREMLSSDISDDVRGALEAREEAGRSSVAKLQSMLDVADPADDRARGLLLYSAAHTGRWAGRLIQPHNFPRGEVDDVESYIPDVMGGLYDTIDLFAPPIVVVSSMLRAMLIAAPGSELISADYSGIEMRVVNWLAGQEDVCALLRTGVDVYKVMACKMGLAATVADVSKQDRQAGKAAELGCGFGMGAKKFVTAAKDIYGVTVTDEQAKAAVDIYRSSHARVSAFWYETEDACIEAVRTPGVPRRFGGHRNLVAMCAGAYLYIVLPSGRPLCYAAPRIVERLAPWGEMKDSLEYSGIGFANAWMRLGTYGGKLVENIVQAVSRDLMADGMLRAEAAGYAPVLSVHDEVVAEVPEGFGTETEYRALLTTLPSWADGCPVAAESWRAKRYRK